MSITSVGAELKPTTSVAGIDATVINKNNNNNNNTNTNTNNANSIKQQQLINASRSANKAEQPVKVSDVVENNATVTDAKQAISVPLSAEQLEKVAQQLQDFVGEMNRGLEFTVDKDSGRDVIKVIDKNSGDLVKQYPSEEVLSLVAKLSEMIGSFVDAKV
jgi:flagellar protein FlaG